jgi:integrase
MANSQPLGMSLIHLLCVNNVTISCRHTFVQWALLLGVAKTRLVDLMGHSTNKMIDEVYGTYRHGLVDEKEAILDYLGEDSLALEELKTTFPERYRCRMAVETPEKTESPGPRRHF